MKKPLMILQQSIPLVLLLLCCGYVQGAPLYQVETIVFQQSDDNAPMEASPSEPMPGLAEAQLLHAAVSNAEPQAYDLLPQNQWQLTSQEWALRHKGEKRILFHASWIQPILTSKATAIRIQGGHVYRADGEIITDLDSHAPYNTVTDDSTELLGTLILTQQRFINAQINLIMQMPTENNAFVTTSQLKQHQRMKENELHYFDNPHLGVLIKIIPYGQNK
ncbi:MAG: CsiV family protein [Gammaproteobacteria bacterium]